MFVKHVIRRCVVLMLIGSAVWSVPVPPGFVEGHVKIFPLRDANLTDDGDRANTDAEPPYSEYPLIIRSRDGKKEVTQVTVNRDGNYRVELPPGEYMLDLQESEGRPVRVKPRFFTIVSNQTVRVDMDIDTGIR